MQLMLGGMVEWCKPKKGTRWDECITRVEAGYGGAALHAETKSGTRGLPSSNSHENPKVYEKESLKQRRFVGYLESTISSWQPQIN